MRNTPILAKHFKVPRASKYAHITHGQGFESRYVWPCAAYKRSEQAHMPELQRTVKPMKNVILLATIEHYSECS